MGMTLVLHFSMQESDHPGPYPVEGICLGSNLPVRYLQVERYSSVWV